MICIINKPHEKGEYHHVFKFDDILAVKNPGKKAGCKDREPGYGVEGNSSERKTDGKRDEKELERNSDFEFKKSNVTKNAYNCCNNSAGGAEKIVGSTHKGELDALDGKDFIFVFDKAGEHHYSAGNYGNYVCNNDYNTVIQ